jgi:Tfp pilus assembly protein PilN
MIRINLLKSFGSNSSEVLQQIDDQKNIQVTFLKKLMIISLGFLALFGYEQYIIPKLTDEQAVLQTQFNELSTFNQKKEALKIEIEKYEKDRVRLNRQTEFLQKIQRERILSVDFIKKIQELIPQGVWLTALKVDGLQIEIKGEADSEKEINDFNLKLASIAFLKDVIVLSIDLKPADSIIRVPIKSFSMKAVFFDQIDATLVSGGKE